MFPNIALISPMVRVIGTVWVMPPPVAFTVTVNVPVVADLLALRVIVEVPEPGAAIDVLLNDTVTPLPSPDAESAIAESKAARHCRRECHGP